MPNKSQKRGFTLIELLVAVAIVGILATIGLLTYGTFIKNARDSRRQADLKAIQSALEQYFADQFYYPCTITFGSALTSSIGNCSATTPSTIKTYLNTLPSEQLSSSSRSPYYYAAFATSTGGTCDNSTTKCSFYCLWASAESISNFSTGCSVPAANPTAYNYSVIPQ